jgi:dihydrofolate reductase
MNVSIIVATDRNGAIGKAGKIPWGLQTDMAHFQKKTTGHHVVMGRKTWESLPKSPLPGRTNIVLTRNPEYPLPEGVIRASSFEEAYRYAEEAGETELFVIGGAEIYIVVLLLYRTTTTIYLTQVDTQIEGADAHFVFQDNGWVETARLTFPQSGKDQYPFAIITLEAT